MPQGCAGRRDEDEIVWSALDRRREIVVELIAEEGRDGDGPRLVVLGGPEVEATTDLGEALGYLDPGVDDVDASPTQGSGFSPSETARVRR